MRKSLAVLFVFVITGTVRAETLFLTDNYTIIRKNSVENVTDAWIQKGLTKRFGLFGWAQTNKLHHEGPYCQTYGGGYLKVDWLQVGVAGGIEQATNKARFGSFAYANKAKASIFAVYENGGSGYWYLIQPKYQVTKRFALGTHSQAYIGHGVRTETTIMSRGNWTTTIWVSALWSEKTGARPTAMAGLRFTFFKGE